MGVEIDGESDLFAEFDELKEEWGENPREWTVGTTAEYAEHLEFGTSGPYEIEGNPTLAFEGDGGNMVFAASVEHPGLDPMPFFRPAVNEIRLQGPEGFIRFNAETPPEEIDSAEEFVRTLAFALERRIKEIITEKGLVDMGNLRASVSAIPGTDPSDLPGLEEL